MCNDTDSKAELSSDMRSGPKPLTFQGPVRHEILRISSVPLMCIWFVPQCTNRSVSQQAGHEPVAA